MQVDMSGEHTCWDRTEPVTLEVSTRAAPRSVSVGIAKRRAIRGAQRSPSGGVYIGYEARWHVPKRELPADVIPKPGDVVVDRDEARWTVLTADRNRGGETHALGCVNLVLAHDLRDTVTIERATISHDRAGVAVKTFDRVLATVKARVQEISREVAEERGVRYARERYDVTIDRQLREIDTVEDRVKWVDSGTTRYLDIVAYRQPERIDELPVIECELRE